MKEEHLIVSEVFYSIQGEGRYSGYPAVFLRLAGCNLFCNSASWRCDTIEVWQKGKSTHFEDVLDPYQFLTLRDGAHLVITGGEPMLHQDKIDEFLFWLYLEKSIKPFVEIETNGTIKPSTSAFAKKIGHWNVSFKLSNSGEPFEKRINEVALNWFNQQPNSDFKIVISSEGDVSELLSEHGDLFREKVILMPAGETQEKLNAVRPMVVEQCKILGYRYCDRLHIVTWNQKTGV